MADVLAGVHTRRSFPEGLRRCVALGVGAAAALLFGTAFARGGSPYVELPPYDEAVASSAYRYANVSDEEAFAELDRRGVPYVREGRTPGVRAPIRLAGALHGVDIHSSLSAAERRTSMFEILDARLALALDDFALILARHDVTELVHYTMYRPNVAHPGALAKKPARDRQGGDARAATADGDKQAKQTAKAKGRASVEGKAQKGGKAAATGASATKNKAAKPEAKPSPIKQAPRRKAAKRRVLTTNDEHPHGKWAPPGTRHPAGLAIDVGILKKRDGTYLSVAQHFRGKIGSKTCGDQVPEADTLEARELRAIVCETRDAGVFTYALTPNFDAPHFDHFHLELKPGVVWFLYH